MSSPNLKLGFCIAPSTQDLGLSFSLFVLPFDGGEELSRSGNVFSLYRGKLRTVVSVEMSSDSEFDRLLFDDIPNLAEKNCLKFGEGDGCKKENEIRNQTILVLCKIEDNCVL